MASAYSQELRPDPQFPTHRLFGNLEVANSFPLIICFHGSGESCSPSWDLLASKLNKSYSVLLYKRGSGNPGPIEATKDLVTYLQRNNLDPPYLLIAHSYGGAFARYFLHHHSQDVAGMVLAETGQETALDPSIEREQYRRQLLGDKPLSVIRGNSIIAKWKGLDAVESSDTGADKCQILLQRQMLEQWDAEDERLKRAQLALSRNNRYTHVPDCGHHVIRDRSDVIIAEVHWAMENLHTGKVNSKRPSRLQQILQNARLKLGRDRS